MTRHQRWILALAATIATVVLLPAESTRILDMAVPALWIAAYLAHRLDLLTARIDRTEGRLADSVDIAVADVVIACHAPLSDRRPTGNVRSLH